MVYQFDSDEAEELGVNEAIMVWNLRFWILKNRASEQHFHDGRTWTYNSIPAFRRLFPFWTENQIRTILEKLKEGGVIVVGNYNTTSYDRTAWYAFSDESIWLKSLIHLGKNPDGKGKKGTPVPDCLRLQNWRLHYMLADIPAKPRGEISTEQSSPPLFQIYPILHVAIPLREKLDYRRRRRLNLSKNLVMESPGQNNIVLHVQSWRISRGLHRRHKITKRVLGDVA